MASTRECSFLHSTDISRDGSEAKRVIKLENTTSNLMALRELGALAEGADTNPAVLWEGNCEAVCSPTRHWHAPKLAGLGLPGTRM